MGHYDVCSIHGEYEPCDVCTPPRPSPEWQKTYYVFEQYDRDAEPDYVSSGGLGIFDIYTTRNNKLVEGDFKSREAAECRAKELYVRNVFENKVLRGKNEK